MKIDGSERHGFAVDTLTMMNEGLRDESGMIRDSSDKMAVIAPTGCVGLGEGVVYFAETGCRREFSMLIENGKAAVLIGAEVTA